MRILSDACEYGLRSAIWLARRPVASYTTREIAEGTKSTPGYLVKVLQRLAKAGILSAQRGRQGGFLLERTPDEITVLDIINAVDPYEKIESCPLGFSAHGKGMCPLHRRLDDAVTSLESTFGAVTIGQLVAEPAKAGSVCLGLIPVGVSISENGD